MITREKGLALLRLSTGVDNADFRENQWEAIENVALKRRKLLVVERTGWGKSLVYFLATKILRDDGFGTSLIISPLLALMRNQVYSAKKLSVNAVTINSSNVDDWNNIQADVIGGKVDALLISPERLANDTFVENVIQKISNKIGMLVIDEAHCISDWGHDFRPDYKRINNIIGQMPDNVPILATTATANDRVVNDIKSQIGEGLLIQRGSLLRKSIQLQSITLPMQAERLAWLLEVVPKLPKSGIIYTLTTRDAKNVANWMSENGISSLPYYSGITSEEFPDTNDYRLFLEEQLSSNKIKVLVATVALGMGYDKPDLGFVIHYQAPGSIIAYYQQVGRAGRAIEEAYGILVSGEEDDEIHEFFRENAFPKADWVHEILTTLGRLNGASILTLEQEINLKRGQIEKTLKYLSVQERPPVIKVGTQWSRTVNPYKHDVEYITRMNTQRENEWNEVKHYIDDKGCRMIYLSNVLDDKTNISCGQCDNCLDKEIVSSDYNQASVNKASLFLKKADLSLQCRVQIPKNALVQYNLSGNLPVNLRAREGRILSRWRDAGWGTKVAEGKRDGFFSDELVEAMETMIKERWKPDPIPTWITSIPSRSGVVEDFAKRLANKLGIIYQRAVIKIKENDFQKKQENVFHQFNNLDGVFSIDAIEKGPVFLFDDVVDSKASMTTISALLLKEKIEAVFPITLSTTNLSLD